MSFAKGFEKTSWDVGSVGRAIDGRRGQIRLSKESYFPALKHTRKTSELRKLFPEAYKNLRAAVSLVNKSVPKK